MPRSMVVKRKYWRLAGFEHCSKHPISMIKGMLQGTILLIQMQSNYLNSVLVLP
jgi:hypothetical protein